MITQYKYLMTGHKCNDSQKLYIWASPDGLRWKMIRNGPLYEAPEYVLRDPSIIWYRGWWWMVYTNNNIDPTIHVYTGDRFGVAKSRDLYNWEHVTWVQKLPDGYSTVNYCWAPEWFLDDDGQLYCIVALKGNPANVFHLFDIHPLNGAMTSWSAPTKITGIQDNIIDGYIIKENGTYYLFYKRESCSPAAVIYAASTSPLSGYTPQVACNWCGWSDLMGNHEGPSLVKIGNTWRIYLDDYENGGIYYDESSDLFENMAGAQLMKNPGWWPAHPGIHKLSFYMPERLLDPERDLILHFKMDETSGTTVVDSSINGLDAISRNNVNTMTIPGKLGNALEFDASKPDRLTVVNNSALDSDDITVAFWVKTTSTATGTNWYDCPCIISRDEAGLGNDGYAIFLKSGHIGFVVEDVDMLGHILINDGYWHFVICIKDGQNMFIFIDNQLDMSEHGIADGAQLSNDEPIYIGSPPQEEDFNGALDDFRIYKRALTAYERAKLYNNGFGTQDDKFLLKPVGMVSVVN